MAWGIQGLINASDLKHCNLLVLGRGKGSWKSVLVLIRQWGEAKMFLCWGEAAGEAGTGAGDGSWGAGPCPAGTARTVNSCVFQGCSSEAFLLVAIPQGCSCSPWLWFWAYWEHCCSCAQSELWKTLKQTSASNTSFPVVVLAMNFLHCSAFPHALCYTLIMLLPSPLIHLSRLALM